MRPCAVYSCSCPHQLTQIQSTALLDPEVEARLGNEILEALEEDIAKELEIELEIDSEDGETLDENNLTYSSDGAGNLKPHRNSFHSNSDEIEEKNVLGGRRRVRTTTKGSVVVVNEFASELLYIMRTATEMLT